MLHTRTHTNAILVTGNCMVRSNTRLRKTAAPHIIIQHPVIMHLHASHNEGSKLVAICKAGGVMVGAAASVPFNLNIRSRSKDIPLHSEIRTHA
jgi:hypothetical protein